jgi:hypothetical protein
VPGGAADGDAALKRGGGTEQRAGRKQPTVAKEAIAQAGCTKDDVARKRAAV